MTDRNHRKVVLLDQSAEMTMWWAQYFQGLPKSSIEIVRKSYIEYMANNDDVVATITPGNSFGLMDGGFDKAIVDNYGLYIQEDIQQAIKNEYSGEMPPGSVMTIRTKDDKYVIYAPTMRLPSMMNDFRIISDVVRVGLTAANKLPDGIVVIPGLGTSTGRIPYEIVAMAMLKGYKQWKDPKISGTWTSVDKEVRRIY